MIEKDYEKIINDYITKRTILNIDGINTLDIFSHMYMAFAYMEILRQRMKNKF